MRATSVWFAVLLVACGANGSDPSPVDGAVAPVDAAVDAAVDAGPVGGSHASRGTVAGGVKASSAHYKLIGTTSPGGEASRSSSYQVKTGGSAVVLP